ncbi:MAG: oxygen-independent coproporphyrinogen III oxidase-like protein [Proteobacteria bacterium]|nr:oxygen-independent coproporphyrinogen III oxidase-like protein [Burkholderiales bacterium]
MSLLPIGFIAPRRLAVLPPLALYIHIPWCVRKCPYCDFNSHEARGTTPEDRYVDALIADLESALPSVWGRRTVTVFFGGGTPSLFAPRSIETVLDAVRARLSLDADVEITLEANPGTFEVEKFRAFRDAGVNRLSIGVQSFQPDSLRALGRVHDGDEARAAIEGALRWFGRVNVDLMYALPEQTPEAALADLETALALGVRHLSAYQLTVEPNTYFHRYPPKLPDEDASERIEQVVHDRLAAAGLERYEISAFAAPGHRARHNLNYWTFGDYLGIGAGAHGKLSLPDRIFRQVRHRQPQHYIDTALAGEAVSEQHDVADDELAFEFMLNALRLVDGVAVRSFTERTGLPLSHIGAKLDAAEARGLLLRDHRWLQPTPLGLRFHNDLVQMFLSDPAAPPGP